MQTKLQKYQAAKEKALAAAETLLKAADKEDRELTADEAKQFDAHTAEVDTLNANIAREEKIRQERLSSPAINTAPGADPFTTSTLPYTARDRRTAQVAGIAGPKTCAKLFGPVADSGGWNSMGEFFATIRAGHNDHRLLAANGMTGGDGPSGAHAMPVAYSRVFLDSILEDSIVLSRCRTYPMTTRTMIVPGFDSLDHSTGSLYGGISAHWIPETGTFSPQKPTLRKVEFTARKLGLLVATSNELATDADGLDAQINTAMSGAAGWHVDDALLNGTGAGQPRGVLNDPALITVDAEAGQGQTVEYENIVNMFARLHPSCVPNSVWVVNSTAIPSLLRLYYPVGLAGTPMPALQQMNGTWSLLTRPVVFSEKLPTLGSKGDILLADFTQYGVGLRQDIAIEKSGHVYFTTDEMAYRLILRLDGQGLWNKAFTPKNGSTQSWCITLAAR